MHFVFAFNYYSRYEGGRDLKDLVTFIQQKSGKIFYST